MTYSSHMTAKLANFYAALVQVTHKEHIPSCDVPGFRILRFVNNEETVSKALAYLEQTMPGSSIKVVRAGDSFCITEKKGQDDAYNQSLLERLRHEADARHSFAIDDYRREYQIRTDEESDIKDAVDDLNEYIREWNSRPWVKVYKQLNGYKNETEIIPGTVRQHEKDAPVPDEPFGAVNDVKPPQGVLQSQHAWAAITIFPDDTSERMEPAVQVIHTWDSEKTALSESKSVRYAMALQPQKLYVVPVGEWILPYDIFWDDKNAEHQEYSGLVDSALIDFQKGREEQMETVMEQMEIHKQRRTISEGAYQAMAKALSMYVEEIRELCKTEEGLDAVCEACEIDDKCYQQDAVEAMREKYLGIKPEDPLKDFKPRED